MVQAHLDQQIWGPAASWLRKEVLPALISSVEVLPSLPLRREEGRVRLVGQQVCWKSWLLCLEESEEAMSYLLLFSDSLMVQVSEMISEKTWVSLLVKFADEV